MQYDLIDVTPRERLAKVFKPRVSFRSVFRGSGLVLVPANVRNCNSPRVVLS
jgi:hypothetical protein